MRRLYDAARSAHGIRTPSELARSLNATPQRIKNWQDRGISQQGATDVQARLGISATYVLDGVGAPLMKVPQDRSADQNWEDIQGFAQAVGLGSGQEAAEYAETHRLKFRAESLSRKRLNAASLAVMYGAGESMLPRIQPGDAIMFDLDDTRPRDGHLYVIMLDGAGAAEYQVKRCEILGDLVYFRADNSSGDHTWKKPRLMTDPKRPITIIGRVRWIGSWEG